MASSVRLDDILRSSIKSKVAAIIRHNNTSNDGWRGLVRIEAKYIAWLPDADADTVRNMPFVRTTSLNNLMKLLFETSVDTSGSFNIDEFMNLLAEVKAESTDEEVIISPLLLAKDEDLGRGFALILDNVEPEHRPILKAKLLEHGWLRNEGATP